MKFCMMLKAEYYTCIKLTEKLACCSGSGLLFNNEYNV